MFKLRGLHTNKIYYTGTEAQISQWLLATYPHYDDDGKSNRTSGRQLMGEPMIKERA